MEKIIYFLIGAVVILIFWVLWINLKLRKIKANFEKSHREIEKLHSDVKILKGRLTQIENINLDFSVIENQLEENTQQLTSFVQERIGEVNKNVLYLEERVNDIERSVDEDTEKLAEIEGKIEDKEEEDE
jgi:chromosome segregation ATPase